jgi:hypothetical protein
MVSISQQNISSRRSYSGYGTVDADHEYIADAKRDRVYCAVALLDILEEPARLKPAANMQL